MMLLVKYVGEIVSDAFLANYCDKLCKIYLFLPSVVKQISLLSVSVVKNKS